MVSAGRFFSTLKILLKCDVSGQVKVKCQKWPFSRFGSMKCQLINSSGPSLGQNTTKGWPVTSELKYQRPAGNAYEFKL